MKIKVVLSTILLFVVLVDGQRSLIKLVNNGYEKVVVAIHQTVAEDPKIIDEIKSMFTEGSEYLYEATRKRAYFRSVTILIPDTWNDDLVKYNSSVDERLITADIRINYANPQFGDDPYTKQPGQCGEPGHYIHFTPSFVLDSDGKRKYTYGPAARLLVHEFAHLRWGVFDEYGYKNDNNYPLFYVSENGVVKPTGCSESIKGVLLNRKTYGLCDIEAKKGLPTDSCYFFSDPKKVDAKGSIMHMQHLPSVVNFCESESTDASLQHNAAAPNKHNKMCKRRGTWDIILEHEDFAGGANPAVTGVVDTTPTFKLVYPRTPNRIVLVLDTSGSMKRNKGVSVPRFYQLKQAYSKFIKDSVPTGTEVGVVLFSNRAGVKSPLTVVANDAVREYMATLLDGHPVGGSTAIAKGINKGMSLFDPADISGSKLLVMTDGQEVVSRYDPVKMSAPNFISDLAEKGVVVDALGFGVDASEDVEVLASKTGGQIYYYSESIESTALDRSLAKAVEEFGNAPYEVESYASIFNGSKSNHTNTVNIDFALGKTTKFVFSCPENSKFDVRLISPSGKNYTLGDVEYDYDTVHNVIRIVIPEAETGDWTYTLSTPNDLTNQTQGVIINVNSLPREGVVPIDTKAWVNKANINYVQDYPVLYADVSQGQGPVINASVRAVVDRPLGGVVTLILKDNGRGADSQKNDGVYSIYFTDILTNGRYSVEVFVDNDGMTAATLLGGGGHSAAMKIWQNDTKDVAVTGLPFFKRTTLAGAFNVRNFTNETDPYPPNAITDLQVAKYSHMNQTVTLIFTAPGDDLDKGRAMAYDIRISNTLDGLSKSFQDALQFTSDDVSEGTMVPDISGKEQTITMKFPNHVENAVLFFAMTSTDAKGNVAELSNIVSAAIRYQGEDDIGLDVDQWAPLITALCGLFTCLLLLAILGVTYYKHRQTMNKIAHDKGKSLSQSTNDFRKV